jgi:carbonic anhydrase
VRIQNISAAEALDRLREGNRRFAADVRSIASLSSQSSRVDLAKQQSPFAIILGCSDSRAPAEIVFDQGLGDLFVIRVAGNIVAPSQVGSVEFAAERFGIRLVVVMGHQRCGAIAATIDAIEQGGAPPSRNILSIVDRIRPTIEPLMVMENRGPHDRRLLEKLSVRANVSSSANHLRHGSPIVESLALHDELFVVGADYDIETGVVDFFDGAPDSASTKLATP